MPVYTVDLVQRVRIEVEASDTKSLRQALHEQRFRGKWDDIADGRWVPDLVVESNRLEGTSDYVLRGDEVVERTEETFMLTREAAGASWLEGVTHCGTGEISQRAWTCLVDGASYRVWSDGWRLIAGSSRTRNADAPEGLASAVRRYAAFDGPWQTHRRAELAQRIEDCVPTRLAGGRTHVGILGHAFDQRHLVDFLGRLDGKEIRLALTIAVRDEAVCLIVRGDTRFALASSNPALDVPAVSVVIPRKQRKLEVQR